MKKWDTEFVDLVVPRHITIREEGRTLGATRLPKQRIRYVSE